MAETPECAYLAARAAPVGARLILTLLYTRVRRAVLVEHLEGTGPVPFVWPGKDWLERLSGCSRTQVYDHLKALEQLGVAVSSQQHRDGKVRKGWCLPLREESSEGRQQHDSDADLEVDAAQPPDLEASKIRPSGNPAERKSGPPDPKVRPSGQENPAERTKSSGPPDHNREENREKNREENRAPAAAAPRALSLVEPPPQRVVARRPHPHGPDGQPVGGDSNARVLVVELAMLFRPTEEGRCFTPANPRHLQLAEQLLHVAAGPDDDPRVLANERLQFVLAYVRDYAAVCQGDPKEAKWWGPGMLTTVPREAGMKPRWDVLMGVVDEWRQERRRQHADASALRERAEAERVESARVAQHRADPEEVARMTAQLTRRIDASQRPPVDEERLRRQGQHREAQASRADQDDMETRRRINEQLLAGMTAKGGPLTTDEAETIRRRVRGDQGATGT